jgi:hypothetical protein
MLAIQPTSTWNHHPKNMIETFSFWVSWISHIWGWFQVQSTISMYLCFFQICLSHQPAELYPVFFIIFTHFSNIKSITCAWCLYGFVVELTYYWCGFELIGITEMAGVPARKSPSTVPIMSRDCTAGEGLNITTGPLEPLQCLDPTMGSTRLWANSARPLSPLTSTESSLLTAMVIMPPARSPSCEQPTGSTRDSETVHAPFIVTDHCQMASAMKEGHRTLSRPAEPSISSQEVGHNLYQITELWNTGS